MITVEHVSKRFGRVTALEDVSLTLSPGERVAIVGSNGSGKTTLLRALCGLLKVEGRILIGGHDVARVPELALAKVAYVPQIAPPLDSPVRELVGAFCRLRGCALETVVQRAQALTLDYAAIAAARVRDLSGGMKQKLLAAMALATEAPVLVCDEPTANLDAASRAAFFARVDARPEGSVLLLCSHRVEEVRGLVSRIIEMKDGRVERDVSVAADAPLLRRVP
jgi:ABC-type multidrug transport system ATPase subunit